VAVIEHSDINIFVADFELEVVEIPVIDYLDLASEYADEFVALLPLVVLQIVDTAMESREHDCNLALQAILQVLQFRQFGKGGIDLLPLGIDRGEFDGSVLVGDSVHFDNPFIMMRRKASDIEIPSRWDKSSTLFLISSSMKKNTTLLSFG
jgi:hypothetical protein